MNKPAPNSSLSEASPSVQTHLGIIQGVIERMASNSTSAKTWCITVVSAMIVVVAGKNKPNYALLAFIPTLLFLALDAYYLGMEKGFRNAYDVFVRKIHNGTLTPDDLYCVKPNGKTSVLQYDALKSFSIWGFYGLLSMLILFSWFVVLT